MDSGTPHTGLEGGERRGRRQTDMEAFETSCKAEITALYPLTEHETLYQIQIVDPGRRSRFTFRPGQFVMLEVPGIGEAPFSITSSPVRHGSLELVVRKVGTLTGFLPRLPPGSQVGIRGPFGTSFPLEKMEGADILLVAGGLGIAPLRSPLLSVLENRSHYRSIDIVYGARSPADLLFTYQYETWRRFGIDLHIVVERGDKGWKGPTGLITDVLEPIVSSREAADVRKNCFAIVCGPPVMFKFVCNLLTAAGVPMNRMFVSLERRMHCGRGKCCRCNVGSTYTCLSGPVFDYWSVMNLKEAI